MHLCQQVNMISLTSGDPNAVGPEQQGAHHRCFSPRRHLLLLSEARERDEHRQRLPALLPALQAGWEELLHPR